MEKKEKDGKSLEYYESPQLEIIVVVVEKGYETSYEPESYTPVPGTWD